MAAKLATRTGSLTAAQAASLDALGKALDALNLTADWNDTKGGAPYASVRLAALQAMRQVTTYRMADKVLARFDAKHTETLSMSFNFAHIGRK